MTVLDELCSKYRIGQPDSEYRLRIARLEGGSIRRLTTESEPLTEAELAERHGCGLYAVKAVSAGWIAQPVSETVHVHIAAPSTEERRLASLVEGVHDALWDKDHRGEDVEEMALRVKRERELYKRAFEDTDDALGEIRRERDTFIKAHGELLLALGEARRERDEAREARVNDALVRRGPILSVEEQHIRSLQEALDACMKARAEIRRVHKISPSAAGIGELLADAKRAWNDSKYSAIHPSQTPDVQGLRRLARPILIPPRQGFTMTTVPTANKPDVVVQSGTYDAQILRTTLGTTPDGLRKFTVEYRLHLTGLTGQHLFQDYVYEEGPDSEANARAGWQLRKLFLAAGLDVSCHDGQFTFNTDLLHGKRVIITVEEQWRDFARVHSNAVTSVAPYRGQG
jgi:hypothetical protein